MGKAMNLLMILLSASCQESGDKDAVSINNSSALTYVEHSLRNVPKFQGDWMTVCTPKPDAPHVYQQEQFILDIENDEFIYQEVLSFHEKCIPTFSVVRAPLQISKLTDFEMNAALGQDAEIMLFYDDVVASSNEAAFLGESDWQRGKSVLTKKYEMPKYFSMEVVEEGMSHKLVDKEQGKVFLKGLDTSKLEGVWLSTCQENIDFESFNLCKVEISDSILAKECRIFKDSMCLIEVGHNVEKWKFVITDQILEEEQIFWLQYTMLDGSAFMNKEVDSMPYLIEELNLDLPIFGREYAKDRQLFYPYQNEIAFGVLKLEEGILSATYRGNYYPSKVLSEAYQRQ